jgi:protein involved in polysaccharide export with SLBB domain
MRLGFNWRCLRLVLIFVLVIPSGQSVYGSSYTVGPGDELNVDFPLRGTSSDLQPLGGNGLTLIVLGNKVFARYAVRVAPDGFISLPAMKPLRVASYTVEEIEGMVRDSLPPGALEGMPSVTLSRANSSAFYVSGEVKNPGRILYERPVSLWEAIAMAGGPTDHAKLGKVLLIRTGHAPQRVDLSYSQLEEHGTPALNVLPSDNVIVPRHWFTPDNSMIFFILSALGTSVAVYAAVK